MKISWIKYNKEENQFKIPEILGLNVNKIENIENVDNKIEELIKDNYRTIIISSEAAGFSENIVKKYQNEKSVNIIITPRKQV